MSLCTFCSCQTKKDQEEEEVDIATCSRGQYFGELALVTNKPRAASAYAVGSVKCLGTFCAVLWSFISWVQRVKCTTCHFTLLKLCLTRLFFLLLFSFSVMDVKAFERLLGPCMDIMKRNIANYEEQLVTLFGSSPEIEQQSAWNGSNGPWIKMDEKTKGCFSPQPLKQLFLQEMWIPTTIFVYPLNKTDCQIPI